MSPDLQQDIRNKFPWMMPRKDINQTGFIDDLYKAFGIDCGDGWYKLICDLCQEITDEYEKRSLEVGVIPEQIKEKYGGLCFYYSLNNPQEHREHNMGDVVFDIVSKYEDLSYEICEMCGEPGKERADLYWIQTLCDSCYKEAMIKSQELKSKYNLDL